MCVYGGRKDKIERISGKIIRGALERGDLREKARELYEG
jgi:hypothetical protein